MSGFNFERLPKEIQLEVLRKADLRTVGRVSKSAVGFRTLSKDELMWRDRFFQRFRGFNGDLIPVNLAKTWFERFQLMNSLLNPKKCFTFLTLKQFNFELDYWDTSLGRYTTILRSFIGKTEDEAINCLRAAYNNRAEPVFSNLNALGFGTGEQLDMFQSPWPNKRIYKSPYFNLTYNLDYYEGLTLCKFGLNYAGIYGAEPVETMITIPGTDSNTLYDLIAFLLNNSKFFLDAWDKVDLVKYVLYSPLPDVFVEHALNSPHPGSLPFLEILRKKTAFIKLYPDKLNGSNFTGTFVRDIFLKLQEQGKETYAILEGPLRHCPLKNTFIYKTRPTEVIFPNRGSPSIPVPSPTLLPSPRTSTYQQLEPHYKSLPPPPPNFFQLQRHLPRVQLTPPPLIPSSLYLPSAPTPLRTISQLRAGPSPRQRFIPPNLPRAPTPPWLR